MERTEENTDTNTPRADNQAQQLAARAGRALGYVEERSRSLRFREKLGQAMERPLAGAAIAGGAVLAAAVMWGAAEAAVAAIAAYGAYRLIRRARGLEPVPPPQRERGA